MDKIQLMKTIEALKSIENQVRETRQQLELEFRTLYFAELMEKQRIGSA